jgi:hypothetical protein
MYIPSTWNVNRVIFRPIQKPRVVWVVGRSAELLEGGRRGQMPGVRLALRGGGEPDARSSVSRDHDVVLVYSDVIIPIFRAFFIVRVYPRIEVRHIF